MTNSPTPPADDQVHLFECPIKRIEDIPSVSDLPEQRIEFLVDGYLAKSSVTLVCGEAGAGKSTWALALACAVSKGEPFAGIKTQRAPVLYLDRENPLPVAQQRLREQNTRTSDDFHYWGLWMQDEPAPLSHPMIVQYASECTVKPLIIFDSLAAFNLEDENSVEKIRKFMEPARRLANQQRASVLIIHHTGKADGAQEYRGSSAIKDAVDVAFRIRKKGTKNTLDRLNVKPFKMRFRVSEEREFRYENGLFSSDGELSGEHPLFTVLRDHPFINGTAFEKAASKLGFSKGKVGTFLKENWDLIGHIDGDKNSKQYFLYETVDALSAEIEAA